MKEFYEDFPFEELRDAKGDYFHTLQEAKDAGHDEDHIWSVVFGDETVTYGPSQHYVNRLGYVATREAHDGETYYHEEIEFAGYEEREEDAE